MHIFTKTSLREDENNDGKCWSGSGSGSLKHLWVWCKADPLTGKGIRGMHVIVNEVHSYRYRYSQVTLPPTPQKQDWDLRLLAGKSGFGWDIIITYKYAYYLISNLKSVVLRSVFFFLFLNGVGGWVGLINCRRPKQSRVFFQMFTHFWFLTLTLALFLGKKKCI